jgi:hypothetical protein
MIVKSMGLLYEMIQKAGQLHKALQDFFKIQYHLR